MKKVLIIFGLLLCLFGCSKQEYHKGNFDGLLYTNSYFGFRMEYLDGYHVYSNDEMAQTLGITVEQLQQQSANETMYEYMVGAKTGAPLFQFYIENYKFTTLATYDDFIAQVVQQFSAQEEMDYTVGAVDDVELNGVIMKKIPLHINAGYYIVCQDVYMIKKDSYVGTLMVTYLDIQKNEVEEIIQSIEFCE